MKVGGEMKKGSVGGQAVMEGVMMKSLDRYTVAVRKPNKEIELDYKEYISLSKRKKLYNLPLVRGVIAFGESMVIGVKTLTYSAEFFEVEDENNNEPSKFDKFMERIFGEKLTNVIIGFSVLLSVFFSIGLFFLLPMFLVELVTKEPSYFMRSLLEGIARLTIFGFYIFLISRLKDIQRFFQYHGAEHKTINCLEHEEELTVENVKKHSRFHKRCGTSFLLIVMVISILVFMFVRVDNLWLRTLSRIIFVPIIAGISYEVLKFAGKNDSKLVDIISYPGVFMQKFTTNEPDESQIEVAIAAVKGVLDDEQYKKDESENSTESIE